MDTCVLAFIVGGLLGLALGIAVCLTCMVVPSEMQRVRKRLQNAEELIAAQKAYIARTDRRFDKAAKRALKATRNYDKLLLEVTRHGADVWIDSRNGEVILRPAGSVNQAMN